MSRRRGIHNTEEETYDKRGMVGDRATARLDTIVRIGIVEMMNREKIGGLGSDVGPDLKSTEAQSKCGISFSSEAADAQSEHAISAV